MNIQNMPCLFRVFKTDILGCDSSDLSHSNFNVVTSYIITKLTENREALQPDRQFRNLKYPFCIILIC